MGKPTGKSGGGHIKQNAGATVHPMEGGRYPKGGGHEPPVASGKTVGVEIRGTHAHTERHHGVTRPHASHAGSHDHLAREHADHKI